VRLLFPPRYLLPAGRALPHRLMSEDPNLLEHQRVRSMDELRRDAMASARMLGYGCLGVMVAFVLAVFSVAYFMAATE
jgi:hypothetical protein